MQFLNRINSLQKNITSTDIFLLSNPSDIAYFTGFSTLLPSEREAIVLVTNTTCLLLHAAFSPVEKVAGFEYYPRCSPSDITTKITDLSLAGKNKIWTDSQTLFVEEYLPLLSIKELEVVQMDRNTIWQLRHIKDDAEQQVSTLAAQLTNKAYQYVSQLFKVGVTEKELAFEIEFFIKKNNSELGFPSIVAFGEHASLPHHQPTDTKLSENTAILIDLGAKINGYSGDMTRTIWFGKNPDSEFLKVEKIIHSAYKNALETVQKKRDLTASELDLTVRTLIEESGYGKQFIHTTGHGLGLDVHESPSIYKTNDTKILPGMVITIEPGIYLPGKFGYRYENTILITADTAIELTN